MESKNIQMAVHSILTARWNGMNYAPIKAADIRHRINMQMVPYGITRPVSSRHIRLAVAELRREGVPVVSGDFGYYITNDAQVLIRCAKRYEAMARHTMEIAGLMRAAASGQMAMKL